MPPKSLQGDALLTSKAGHGFRVGSQYLRDSSHPMANFLAEYEPMGAAGLVQIPLEATDDVIHMLLQVSHAVLGALGPETPHLDVALLSIIPAQLQTGILAVQSALLAMCNAAAPALQRSEEESPYLPPQVIYLPRSLSLRKLLDSWRVEALMELGNLLLWQGFERELLDAVEGALTGILDEYQAQGLHFSSSIAALAEGVVQVRFAALEAAVVRELARRPRQLELLSREHPIQFISTCTTRTRSAGGSDSSC